MTFKKITCIFSTVALTLTMGVTAMAQELVPGGRALGIRMTTDGVMVAGVCGVETESGEVSPASDAGIMEGDIIIKLGSQDVSTAEDFIAAAKDLDGEKISVTVDRQGKTRQLNVNPALGTDGAWKLGLWLRDGISGVGTLTFYDPESGVYGALGHSINNSETGAELPLGSGEIFNAEVVGIVPGEVGAPGELSGCTDEAQCLGDIQINCGCGIFGTADLEGSTMETGEIKPGDASILCTLEGDEVQEYGVEIKRVFESGSFTAVMLTVTDPTLLEKTGGIVQGMSGSPIIQEGKLVGAVTHVFVNDPTSGYGVSIQDMLAAAENCDRAA